MTERLDLERRLAAHYATEDLHRVPDRVLLDALAIIDTTPQRRPVFGVPWRIPNMNLFAKVAIAAVAVIAVSLAGLSFLRPGPPVGGPAASPSLEETLHPSAPPLGATYSSAIHGISISHPAAWLLRPATEPWTTEPPRFDSPAADVIYNQALTDHLFLLLSSQALDGRAGEDWAAEFMSDPIEGCSVAPQPVSVDGADGVICGTSFVMAWTGDRGYLIWLYTSGDNPWLADWYNATWFESLLETVQLRPEDAADVSPSPS